MESIRIEKSEIKNIKAFILNILVISPDKKLLRIEVAFNILSVTVISLGKTIIIPR